MNRHIETAATFIGLTFLVNWSLASAFFALGGHWHTPAGIVPGVVNAGRVACPLLRGPV
ncbi:MAG: hypothetical protein JW955_10655 [Sedimentisphaerales bacterium]|nr:hypothetical protein [Sedimentisphaerales bacterium]